MNYCPVIITIAQFAIVNSFIFLHRSQLLRGKGKWWERASERVGSVTCPLSARLSSPLVRVRLPVWCVCHCFGVVFIRFGSELVGLRCPVHAATAARPCPCPPLGNLAGSAGSGAAAWRRTSCGWSVTFVVVTGGSGGDEVYSRIYGYLEMRGVG